ncbi:hypothetical protein FOL47_000574 [Perkinsus chesapeaki]|uniref:Cation/H+ exchanger transmembrane domain-containing protein n=1 Tax=Perkinsus chesapeaki TaxID=330153 RepID=A0A7J6MM36_PERCH|nr:hypothetical protein FOL47_000574 [Perkinsus chesapeaki]
MKAATLRLTVYMSFVDDNAATYESLVSGNSVLFSIGLLIAFISGYLVNTGKVRHISESTASVIIGFTIGIIMRLLGTGDRQAMLSISAELFYFALLPPIIFEASFSLNMEMFMNNLTSILTFAFIGTDPVAVLALMGGTKYRPNRTLHSLVFGESVLNDAVAIVLFVSHQQAYFSGAADGGKSMNPLFHFLIVTLGSIIFGVMSGALVSATYRKSSVWKFPKYEIGGMFLSIYITFSLSELLGLSGIMAIFFFGLMLARYNLHNLSQPSQVASKLVFKTLAFFSESLVFLYLGIVACMSIGEYRWNVGLIVFTLALIVFARACNVYPLSWLLNHLTRYQPITINTQIVLWLAGIRGAIAFVLMLRMPTRLGDETRDVLVTTTISIIVVTTLLGGPLVEHIAVTLGELRPTQPSEDRLKQNLHSDMASGIGRAGYLPTELSERLNDALEYVDRKYIQQYLGGPPPPQHEPTERLIEEPLDIGIDTYYRDNDAKRLMIARSVVFE